MQQLETMNRISNKKTHSHEMNYAYTSKPLVYAAVNYINISNDKNMFSYIYLNIT